MRPVRLRLRGITTFDDVEVDLSGLDGLIAVVGPNGSGKTTVMEALCPGALYRVAPCRESSRLLDLATRSDALLELDVEHGGVTYRAMHQIDPAYGGGRGKAEAYLYADGVAVVPSGKVREFDDEVARRFPPLPVVLASVFASQTGSGNFLALSKQDRRDLFAMLLGSEELQALSVQARDARKRTRDILGELDRVLDVQRQRAADLHVERQHLEDLRARLPDARRAHEDAVEADRRAQDALRSLRERAAASDAARRARGTVEVGLRSALERLNAHTSRVPPVPPDRSAQEIAQEKQTTADAWVEARRSTPKHAPDVEGVERRAGLIDTVPCGAGVLGDVDCGACPLLRDAVEAREALPDLRATREAFETGTALLGSLEAKGRELSAELDMWAHHDRWVAEETRLREDVERLTADLDKLPEAPPAVDLGVASGAAQEASRVARDRWDALRTLERDVDRLEARVQALDSTADVEAVEERRKRVRDLHAGLALVEVALGRDGVQALEIDAAGPEVSDLVNGLMTACYGPRFAVELRTVQEAGAGRKQKEVFDVVVHDGRTGTSRLVGDLSGGERVLVGEALKLALAIFASRRAGVRLDTLWRDEVDGALDADTAARYPAMLRAALDLGGFSRCYYVTHREDVATQADAWLVCGGGTVEVRRA